jgi:hypothetical protein
MELDLAAVIRAILQVCPPGRAVFTPSSVRKQLQHTTPELRQMQTALLSARMQPHLRLLERCESIALEDPTQRRNRPRRIVDRERLEELLRDPGRARECSTETLAVAAAAEPADDLEDVVPEVQDVAPGQVRLIRDVQQELLDGLDEHESDLQEKISAVSAEIMSGLRGIEREMASLQARLNARDQRLTAALTHWLTGQEVGDRQELTQGAQAMVPTMKPPATTPPAHQGVADALDDQGNDVLGEAYFHDCVSRLANARPLIEVLKQIADAEGLEVYYTQTRRGDLRVKASRPGETRVIFTAYYQQSSLACGGWITPQECVDLGLPPGNLRTPSGPLLSNFIVVPGPDTAAFLAIFCSAIRKFGAQ